MLNPYMHLMRRPGAAAFFAAGVVGRMPTSMMGLGMVILVAKESGSYGLAGAVAGAAVIATAIVGPVQGRFVDRYSQFWTLLLGSLLSTAALTGLLFAVHAHAPAAVLYGLAGLTGGTRPQVNLLVRARWRYLLGRGRALQTAYALEVVGEEVVFIVGPVIVTTLVTQASPYAAVAAAGLVGLSGSLSLALLRATDPPGQPRASSGGYAKLPWLSLLLLSVVGFGHGATLGGAEVVTVAFAQSRNMPGMAGVVLAVWALGSVLAGLAYGAVHWRAPVESQLLACTVATAVTIAALPWIDSVTMLGVALFACGLTIAPTMVSVTSCVEAWVPPQRLTEAIGWVVTGILFGLASGNAASGYAVDRNSPSVAYWVPFCIAVVTALITAVTVVLPAKRLTAQPQGQDRPDSRTR